MMKFGLCVFALIAVASAQLPFAELKFADDALEPYIDNMTMFLHHDRHYAGQVRGVNSALSECGLDVSSYSAFGRLVLPLIGTDQVPQQCPELWPSLVNRVRNSGGGAYNHQLFWNILTPASSSNTDDISEQLMGDFDKYFGSFDGFKEEYTRASLSVFGSGWSWLVASVNGLDIITTANQDNPLMSLDVFECTDIQPGAEFTCEEQSSFGKCWDPFMVPAGNCLRTCGACSANKNVVPLLNLDMWEHAHYLKYNNRRSEYVDAFWSVINWDYVNSLYINQ